MKNILVIILGVGIVMLTGCTSVRPVQHTIEKTDSVIIKETLVPVKVPGSAVSTSLSKAQLDSLTRALRSMPANNRTVYLNDPTLKTRLSFALDSLGKLMIKCESIEQMYMAKLIEKDRYINVKELEIREQQKSFGQKLSNYFDTILWTVIGAFAIIGLGNLAILIFKR